MQAQKARSALAIERDTISAPFTLNILFTLCTWQALNSNLCAQVFERDIVRPQRLHRFASQALANIVWSFATLRWYPHAVLEAVTLELHNRLPILTMQARPLPPLVVLEGKARTGVTNLAWLPQLATEAAGRGIFSCVRRVAVILRWTSSSWCLMGTVHRLHVLLCMSSY